jgi:MFS family permease
VAEAEKKIIPRSDLTPPADGISRVPLCVVQLVFAFGSLAASFPLMLLGRTLYGLGGENLSVGQSALVAEWFKVRTGADQWVGMSNQRMSASVEMGVGTLVWLYRERRRWKRSPGRGALWAC